MSILYLRRGRPGVEFNQVLLGFQLAKVMIMTAGGDCAAEFRLPIGFWLQMSIRVALH